MKSLKHPILSNFKEPILRSIMIEKPLWAPEILADDFIESPRLKKYYKSIYF